MYPYLRLWNKHCSLGHRISTISGPWNSVASRLFSSHRFIYLRFVILFQKFNSTGEEQGWKLKHTVFKKSALDICGQRCPSSFCKLRNLAQPSALVQPIRAFHLSSHCDWFRDEHVTLSEPIRSSETFLGPASHEPSLYSLGLEPGKALT